MSKIAWFITFGIISLYLVWCLIVNMFLNTLLRPVVKTDALSVMFDNIHNLYWQVFSPSLAIIIYLVILLLYKSSAENNKESEEADSLTFDSQDTESE